MSISIFRLNVLYAHMYRRNFFFFSIHIWHLEFHMSKITLIDAVNITFPPIFFFVFTSLLAFCLYLFQRLLREPLTVMSVGLNQKLFGLNARSIAGNIHQWKGRKEKNCEIKRRKANN